MLTLPHWVQCSGAALTGSLFDSLSFDVCVAVVLSAAWAFMTVSPRVVIRIVFIFRAVVGDALNHYFGIVAAGQCALSRTPNRARIGSCARWSVSVSSP